MSTLPETEASRKVASIVCRSWGAHPAGKDLAFAAAATEEYKASKPNDDLNADSEFRTPNSAFEDTFRLSLLVAGEMAAENDWARVIRPLEYALHLAKVKALEAQTNADGTVSHSGH